MLLKAHDFLAAAEREADASPSVAYATAYAAARQGVTALMWAQGLRVASKSNEHEIAAEFAVAAIPATRDLDPTALDRMRRKRHQIEYEPGRDATVDEARHDCSFVKRLLFWIDRQFEAA
jgi:hypothetical protein